MAKISDTRPAPLEKRASLRRSPPASRGHQSRTTVTVEADSIVSVRISIGFRPSWEAARVSWAPVTDSPTNPRAARSEAGEATRGSAIKLVTELVSRLLGFLTTPILTRGLGGTAFRLFPRPSLTPLIAAGAAEL